MLNKIINSEALHFCKNINNNSIDLVLIDPPYAIDKMNETWDINKINNSISNLNPKGVIGGIPDGMKFDTKQAKNLQLFLEPIFLEYYRILKPGAFCLVFSQSRSSYRVGLGLENAGFEVRDQLIWDYGQGQQKAQSISNFVNKNRNLTESEKIKLLEETKHKKTPQLAPAFETIWLAQKPKDGNTVENYLKWKTGLVNFYLDTISVKFQISKTKTIEKDLNYKHPTQKPEKLIKELIYRFSNENDTILDTFMGSGTTAICSLKLNRNFLGCDFDNNFVLSGNERIEKLKNTNLNKFFE